VGVTLNCEKLVKLLAALQQQRQAARAAVGSFGAGGAAGSSQSWGAAGPLAGGLLLQGGGRVPGSQCDVLVCARGGDGLLQVCVCVCVCV
jgi:hypothetical protein